MRERKRRTALAIGAALALLTACGGGDTLTATPPTPIRWIAAGDSYASGEGAAGARGHCGRTEQAMVQRAHDLISGEVEIDAFAHVACNGTVIDEVLAQVRAASISSSDVPFNLVTLTIGGNDAGFAKVLLDCVGADGLLSFGTSGKTAGCNLTEAELIGRVDALRPRLVELYKAIVDELAPRGALVVVGYPNIYADPDGWGDDMCAGLAKPDAMTLRRVATELDARIADAAEQAGATFVSMIDAFKGHELCGPDERWMHSISLGLRDGTVRPTRSFHPNDLGQQAEAEALASALRVLYRTS